MSHLPWTPRGHLRRRSKVRWDRASTRHYIGAWTDSEGREHCLGEYHCPPETRWDEFLLGRGWREYARAHGHLPAGMLLGNREAFLEWAELVIAFEAGDTARIDSWLRDLGVRVELPHRCVRRRCHDLKAVLHKALYEALTSSPGTVLEKFLGLGQQPRIGREERHALLRGAVRENARRIFARIDPEHTPDRREVALDEDLPDPSPGPERQALGVEAVQRLLARIRASKIERLIASELSRKKDQAWIAKTYFHGDRSPVNAFLMRARRAARQLDLKRQF